MKKIAVRGMIILSVIVACSMFFAQTILTITTPKVKIEVARQGKFEDKLTLSGKVYFEKTEPYTPEGLGKNAVTIDKLYVKPGDWVEAGATIADASLSEDYEDAIETAREAVQKAQSEYRQNELANVRLVENTDSDKNNAIRGAEDALYALMDAQEALIVEAAKQGVMLSADATTWAETIGQTGNETLIALMQDVMDAQKLQNEADDLVVEVFKTSRTKAALYEFIEKRVTLQRAVDKAQEELLTLITQSEQAKTIRAPHAGYVTELNLEKGKAYDGTKSAFSLSVDSEPVMRCDISGSEREFTEGMRADIKSEYDDIRSSIAAVVREGMSGKFLHIALEEDTITRLGGMRALMTANLSAKVTYKSKQNTTLLTPSVVRSEGEGMDFVYVIDYEYDFWGTKMKLRKQSVTVLERGDTEISIAEEMRGTQLADKEDRAISDGQYVMEYVN